MTNSKLYKRLEFERELARRRARTNLLSFTRFTFDDYASNWHHEYLCDAIDRLLFGDLKRLMCFMPPQHGKSELVSRRLPALALGINPKLKIVGASYSSDLSQQFNREVQRIIDTPEYHELFPDTYLNKSNVKTSEKGSFLRNADIFETVGHKGFYKSVGVGGSLTGTPADIAIIDDPVKDAIEAMSPTYRGRTWDWYNDVLSTRLHNDSKVLLTLTRWNEDDLAGRILKSMERTGEHWEIVNFPAIKENNSNKDDPRKVGGALWPEKHSLERLKAAQSRSPRTFASLYQQDPKPVQTGGEFYKDYSTNLQTEREYSQNDPLHITFDFNVLPYVTATVWQVSGNKAVQIDEILAEPPHNHTEGLCKMILRHYGKHENGCFIYGDPAGKHKDTRSVEGHNDFDIIMRVLKVLNPVSRVARSAPGVAVRGNFINAIFRGETEIKLLFGENCINTHNDYLFIKENADGSKLKEKMKNENGATYEKYGHVSDANDYFICECFKRAFSDFKRGKSTFTPTLGTLRDSGKF